MRPGGALLVAVLPLAAFAGCIGDGGGSSEEEEFEEDPFAVPEVEVGEGGGAVRGVVTDEAIVPLAGARVVIEELDLSTVTGEDSTFGFAGVPAGTYRLRAERVGYNPAVRSVQVAEGGEEFVEFRLKAVPREVAYTHELDLTGWWECNTHELNCRQPIDATPLGQVLQASDEQKFEWSIGLDRNVATVVAEVVWTAKQPTADTFTVTIRNPAAPDSKAFANVTVTGPSPLELRVERDLFEEAGMVEGGSIILRVDLAPSDTFGSAVGVAFQQEFDIFYTGFYLDPASSGFTRRPAA